MRKVELTMKENFKYLTIKRLDDQETLNGYYHITKQILINYGIPYMFKTDKRTVFEYKRKGSSLLEDTFTQFAYACSQLGIQLETSSVY